ncbi:hypothetical protein A4G99_20490 [Haladaptatus sp. R4]|uniref:hypothetical protein n=1 Tax=Haladaptatus sp. R4 TaxID=1679489 RepID=UPI0007B4CB95|nr:hypothetical protein [Haladaptatus sp. R4]KZN26437.1 hypothetical protein A4G99_20490 [Haladaptatus sp. R4]
MTTMSVGGTPGETDDERRLYGDPQHEVDADSDPERLYGTPQHENETATDGVTDLWLDCLAFRKSVEGRQ